ncbi:MAG: pyridoxamine 5'-phosphate oxidase family protein [Mesorhizobium sp.]|nr:pyridoxamine 5'-phosphate oxidase family protein [Mesorhizobium sp.]TIM45942.1 MAG: pyridoxamine 5'-phosphate oxidase family protein [Mesorhizobium sp.]
MIIRQLSLAQCTALISENRLARLACSSGNQPYLVPIYYAYDDRCTYSFTMPGRKLDTMRGNPQVALLVEEKGEARSCKSVVAEGRFEELPDRIDIKRERDRAWSLLSQHANWWEPGALKPVVAPLVDHASHVFFRIHVERMSGREAHEK